MQAYYTRAQGPAFSAIFGAKLCGIALALIGKMCGNCAAKKQDCAVIVRRKIKIVRYKIKIMKELRCVFVCHSPKG